ncbi:MAG TPA: thioredoxin [Flavobacteriaceae bacterium]|jgi:thioredoxin 1|nr:thioredoxin [Flavobacteriaceae bacterium]
MPSSFNDLINSNPLVLVDFHATWCGPCKMLAPILIQAKEVLQDAVKIIKIDVDKNPAMAAKYEVRGVPTMILFKNGQPVWRQSGVLQAQAIVHTVQSHV